MHPSETHSSGARETSPETDGTVAGRLGWMLRMIRERQAEIWKTAHYIRDTCPERWPRIQEAMWKQDIVTDIDTREHRRLHPHGEHADIINRTVEAWPWWDVKGDGRKGRVSLRSGPAARHLYVERYSVCGNLRDEMAHCLLRMDFPDAETARVDTLDRAYVHAGPDGDANRVCLSQAGDQPAEPVPDASGVPSILAQDWYLYCHGWERRRNRSRFFRWLTRLPLPPPRGRIPAERAETIFRDTGILLEQLHAKIREAAASVVGTLE
jgi:hypothetical protein